MAKYRVTIRFGAPGQQYHVDDVDAPTLRDAMRQAAERFPERATATADLVEIRRLTDPDERVFGPE